MENTDQELRALIDRDIKKTLEDSNIEGKTLGKYRIGTELGNGGMGTVYHAKDVSLNREVIVKVIRFLSQDPEHRRMMIARFRREAQAASRVMHPNVAVIFAFEEIVQGEDVLYLLIMERIDGRTLRDEIMPEDGPSRALPPRKALAVVIGILKGLEAIHAAKIVHRDLKPGNVMLTHDGDRVKILDLGLAKAAEASGEPVLDLTLTQQGMPLGSPMYMAPEQIKSLPVDERTDLYAVGVILFQLLTGKAPFRGDDAYSIYEKHQNHPVPPIVSPSGPIPPALETVVRKAMAKKPEDRCPSAAAMRAALEAVDFDARPAFHVVPVPPRAASQPPSTVNCQSRARAEGSTVTKPRRSHPGIVVLLPLVLAAALAAGILLVMTGNGERRGPETDAVAVGSGSEPEAKKADSGMEVPPPPPAATAAQGCELYRRGQTSDAIATLTKVIAASPKDAEALFCLCGAYVRQPDAGAEAARTCKAYRAHPGRDAGKARQADLWLRRLR